MKCGRVAQLVEQCPFKLLHLSGSNCSQQLTTGQTVVQLAKRALDWRNWTALWTPLLTIAFLVLALASAKAGSDVPDAPASKTITHGYTGTRLTRIAFTASIVSRTADTIYTCYKIDEGSIREELLPVKTCCGVALWNAGTVIAAFGGQAVLHKLEFRLLARSVASFTR